MIAGVASGSRPYHHGNLRPALISAAIGEIEESGPAAMSLRAVARRAGVTHAAATYHFGDRAGLLTAVAAEGYRLLAEALHGAQETRGSSPGGRRGVRTLRGDPPGPFRGHVPAGAVPPRRRRARARPGGRGHPALRHRGDHQGANGLRGRRLVDRARAGHALAQREPASAARRRPRGDQPGRRRPSGPSAAGPGLSAGNRDKAVGDRIADSTHWGGKLMPYVRAARKPRPDRDLLRGTTAAEGRWC